MGKTAVGLLTLSVLWLAVGSVHAEEPLVQDDERFKQLSESAGGTAKQVFEL